MIFFDIDDTLVDSEGSHLSSIHQLALKVGFEEERIDAQLEKWSTITDHFLNEYFQNKISLEQQRSLRIQAFWKLLGTKITSLEAKNIYQDYHSLFLESCVVFADAIPCLDLLKGHPLGIISNGSTPDQLFKLKYNQLLPYFSVIVISDEVGSAKPDSEIFLHAAAQAGLPLSQCAYIGNSYNIDYLGAKHAGMDAYWLDRATSSQAFCNLTDFATHINKSYPSAERAS